MPAAGRGTRLGGPQPKPLIDVGGRPLFVHAAAPFLAHPDCVEVVIAAPADCADDYRAAAERFLQTRPVCVVAGGATRQQSVARALQALQSAAEAVLIHDAARPLVGRELIDRVWTALHEDCAAVVPGLPVADTVKRAALPSLIVEQTLKREGLFTVQTPQAMLRPLITAAHRRTQNIGFAGTDDAALVEFCRLGLVRIVPGDPRNIKVTTADDLQFVRFVLGDSDTPAPATERNG